jgi:hypothetical protein
MEKAPTVDITEYETICVLEGEDDELFERQQNYSSGREKRFINKLFKKDIRHGRKRRN